MRFEEGWQRGEGRALEGHGAGPTHQVIVDVGGHSNPRAPPRALAPGLGDSVHPVTSSAGVGPQKGARCTTTDGVAGLLQADPLQAQTGRWSELLSEGNNNRCSRRRHQLCFNPVAVERYLALLAKL